MNVVPAHIHLILNYLPIIGVVFVAVHVCIAMIYHNSFMPKVSLLFLVVIA